MSDNILEVKKLKISFRTNNGTVKAVRDISFDLKRGETLAIVGESGSGKSVTSKAILGILAGNSIIDGGEILYDGKDLLKISEDEMYKIRGDKISMIFQDPLSSLNPIVRIGKQITEAMLLKNKASRKISRKEFNKMLAILQNMMIEATGNNEEEATKIKVMTKKFVDFNIEALKLENSYNVSESIAEELIASIKDFKFLYEKKQKVDPFSYAPYYRKKLKAINDQFILHDVKDKVQDFINYFSNEIKTTSLETLIAKYDELEALLNTIVAKEKPNFFRIGYYLYVDKEALPELLNMDVAKMNEMALEYLNNNFMNQFIDYEQRALKLSHERAIEGKKRVIVKNKELREYFAKGEFTKKEAMEHIKEMREILNSSIDHLEPIKDSIAYTFIKTLSYNVKSYFANVISNEKEEKRFAKQSAKHDALVAKGKNVDWKVVPKKIIDLNEQIENLLAIIDRLDEKYQEDIATSSNIDFFAKSIDLIDYFKAKASQVVYKVTKAMAKEKAIKLMEEVGIPEARIRYRQYPFEFSGGMRQRIVIAIALSANPDILICDEPTTALDVTIQSQILELINNLKKERNLSVIFITHDLGVVANMADRIAVMYAGKIVEYGTSEEIFYAPAHPYTWALLSSMPDLDTKEKLEAIPGTPPNMIYPPVGDAFAIRNKYALKIDFEEQPPLFKITDTHYAATWLLHPNAPKVEMPKIIVDRIERMKKAGGDNNEQH